MEIEKVELLGPLLIKPKIFKDNRGFFKESYNKKVYEKVGLSEFVQDNHSFSCKNTLRGMHFQKSPGQDKLVYAVYGKILDVIVDIRKDSKTFKKWCSFVLDDKLGHQLYVPRGFAHGFCILSKTAHVVYKVSNYYIKEEEKKFSNKIKK